MQATGNLPWGRHFSSIALLLFIALLLLRGRYHPKAEHSIQDKGPYISAACLFSVKISGHFPPPILRKNN